MTKSKYFLKRVPRIGFFTAGVLFLLLCGYSVLRCFWRPFDPIYNGLDAVQHFGSIVLLVMMTLSSLVKWIGVLFFGDKKLFGARWLGWLGITMFFLGSLYVTIAAHCPILMQHSLWKAVFSAYLILFFAILVSAGVMRLMRK